MGFFIDLLLGGISAFFSRILVDIVSFASGVIAREHLVAVEILNSDFIINTTNSIQIIAGLLLSIKIAVDVTRQYILFASGDSDSNPVKVLRRAGYAAAMIAGGPWLAREVFTWGAQLSIMVARTPVAGQINPFEMIVNGLVAASIVNFAVIIIVLAALVFYFLILVQTVIRAVELAFVTVAAPIMAVGLTYQEEGVWAVWWRELVVLSLSQAVQMLFLTGFFSAMTNIAHLEILGLSTILMPIGWLFVAYKSPAMLKSIAYHTGVGQSAFGVARSYVTPLIRSLITRGAK
jgi:hypothetical protein